MIALAAFLRGIQDIVDSAPTYRTGGKGKDGTCDCIGLIIGAWERAGGKWRGDHSSNWLPRRGMATMGQHPPLEIGAAMFKAMEPGAPKYSLPDRFKGGSDLRDYYHVGVVTGLEPLRITHCTTGAGKNGIVVDGRIGKWEYGGRIDGIEYEVIDLDGRAIVTAPSGKTVNLRSAAGTHGRVLDMVPVGSEVEAGRIENGWRQVRYAGQTGWMMVQFLESDASISLDMAALVEELEGHANRILVICKAMKGAG